MARTVKNPEQRRSEILDVAQRLVYTEGYEQMTIQDILDGLQISKGAFYHYFGSKGELLEALVERMVTEELGPLLASVVEDRHLSALEKLQRYFDTALRWKSAQKTFVLAVLRVWLADENAIVRQKMMTMSVKRLTPLLAEIVRQGIREGVFSTSYPEQVCQAIYLLLQGLSESIVELLISDMGSRDSVLLETAVADYSNALTELVERVLGARRGSLHLISPGMLKEWFVSPDENSRAPHRVLTGGLESSVSGSP